jgi:hypothetical protein
MKKRILVFILWPFSFSVGDELKPFSSDGCSSFPDGTYERNELWLPCCTAHDLAYWQGGTYEERVTADESLQQCVEEAGEPALAVIMLAGVRVGGTPFFPTKFRWGYGWPYQMGYKKLTPEEKQSIKTKLNTFNKHIKSTPKSFTFLE